MTRNDSYNMYSTLSACGCVSVIFSTIHTLFYQDVSVVSVFTNALDVIINVRLYNTWCMFSFHKTRGRHRHDLFILFHVLRFT